MGLGGFLVIGCLISLVAIGLLIGAVVAYVRGQRQFADRVSAQGTVLALENRVMNPGSAGVYCPVVKFVALNGQEIQFTSEYGTLPASHKVGQSVTVLYNPSDPQKAEVSSGMARYLVPGILVFMGAVALCIGGTFLVFSLLIANGSP